MDKQRIYRWTVASRYLHSMPLIVCFCVYNTQKNTKYTWNNLLSISYTDISNDINGAYLSLGQNAELRYPTANLFYPNANSTLTANALGAYATEDFEGTPRTSNQLPTIGAYEYVNETFVVWTPQLGK